MFYISANIEICKRLQSGSQPMPTDFQPWGPKLGSALCNCCCPRIRREWLSEKFRKSWISRTQRCRTTSISSRMKAWCKSVGKALFSDTRQILRLCKKSCNSFMRSAAPETRHSSQGTSSKSLTGEHSEHYRH